MYLLGVKEVQRCFFCGLDKCEIYQPEIVSQSGPVCTPCRNTYPKDSEVSQRLKVFEDFYQSLSGSIFQSALYSGISGL